MPHNSKCWTCFILCCLAPACTDLLSPAIIYNKKIPFSPLGEFSLMVLIREGLLEKGKFLLPFFVRQRGWLEKAQALLWVGAELLPRRHAVCGLGECIKCFPCLLLLEALSRWDQSRVRVEQVRLPQRWCGLGHTASETYLLAVWGYRHSSGALKG